MDTNIVTKGNKQGAGESLALSCGYMDLEWVVRRSNFLRGLGG